MFLLAAALVIKDLYAFFADSAKYSSSSVVNALEVLRTFEGEKKEGRVIRRKKTCRHRSDAGLILRHKRQMI